MEDRVHNLRASFAIAVDFAPEKMAVLQSAERMFAACASFVPSSERGKRWP
jgi:hypothetical protein